MTVLHQSKIKTLIRRMGKIHFKPTMKSPILYSFLKCDPRAAAKCGDHFKVDDAEPDFWSAKGAARQLNKVASTV